MFAARETKSFIEGLDRPEELAKETLLERIVRPNTACEFGERYGFSSITTVREYRTRVPVAAYEDFRPSIDRMLKGEAKVLVAEPVRRFFLTSGSTGKPKQVPVTSSLIRDKARAFGIYWDLVLEQHPEIERAKIVTNFSDSGEVAQVPGSGLPSSSESAYWSRLTSATRRDKAIIPAMVAKIADSDARYYAIARILLEETFQAIMSLHPSTLLLLFQKMNEFSALLLEDIAGGGVSSRFDVGDEFRTYVQRNYPANQARAQELRRTSLDRPWLGASASWPELKLVICWRSPSLEPYLRLLAPHLGSLRQRDYLSMASEGIICVPIRDAESGGVLPNSIHFYEFIPEDQADRKHPDTYLSHELQLDRRYLVVLSTSGGLYRYNIGDVVKVTGFAGRTPIVEFLYRAGNTCSVTGEKLTEDQVIEAVTAAAAELGLKLASFTAAPADSGFPRYIFMVEFSELPLEDALRAFCREIDRALDSRNIEYGSKRNSQRLGAPELWVVKPGSYQARRARQLRQGANDLQIKPTHLTRDRRFYQQLEIAERVHAD